jgi:hypothetical protein
MIIYGSRVSAATGFKDRVHQSYSRSTDTVPQVWLYKTASPTQRLKNASVSDVRMHIPELVPRFGIIKFRIHVELAGVSEFILASHNSFRTHRILDSHSLEISAPSARQVGGNSRNPVVFSFRRWLTHLVTVKFQGKDLRLHLEQFSQTQTQTTIRQRRIYHLFFFTRVFRTVSTINESSVL